MTERNADAPDHEVEQVARAVVRGMIGALQTEKFSPDLMISAALHILAAWVASSQTRSSATERAEDIEELLDMLPLGYRLSPHSELASRSPQG